MLIKTNQFSAGRVRKHPNNRTRMSVLVNKLPVLNKEIVHIPLLCSEYQEITGQRATLDIVVHIRVLVGEQPAFPLVLTVPLDQMQLDLLLE